MREDLNDLLQRIVDYHSAYLSLKREPPLFRLTPYECRLYVRYLSEVTPNFSYDVIGLVPSFHGINFQLVGAPILFDGNHINFSRNKGIYEKSTEPAKKRKIPVKVIKKAVKTVIAARKNKNKKDTHE